MDSEPQRDNLTYCAGGPEEMSPKLPRITAAELLRALRRDGWYEHHQVGSHVHEGPHA